MTLWGITDILSCSCQWKVVVKAVCASCCEPLPATSFKIGIFLKKCWHFPYFCMHPTFLCQSVSCKTKFELKGDLSLDYLNSSQGFFLAFWRLLPCSCRKCWHGANVSSLHFFSSQVKNSTTFRFHPRFQQPTSLFFLVSISSTISVWFLFTETGVRGHPPF